MPFRGNTGTYYVRNTARTQKLYMDAIVRSNRLKMKGSDQQAMAVNLFDNAASEGLRVKTFVGDETEYLPNGYHYHRRQDMMQKMMDGKANTFLFHMNWASEKTIKVKFLKQMGAWYVQEDTCNFDEANLGNLTTKVLGCCSSEPILGCFFSNRVSVQDCSSSPTLR